MKKLQNLKGAKALNKKEQQSINGGAGGSCGTYETQSQCSSQCPSYPWECVKVFCGPSGPPPAFTEEGWECIDSSNHQ